MSESNIINKSAQCEKIAWVMAILNLMLEPSDRCNLICYTGRANSVATETVDSQPIGAPNELIVFGSIYD